MIKGEVIYDSDGNIAQRFNRRKQYIRTTYDLSPVHSDVIAINHTFYTAEHQSMFKLINKLASVKYKTYINRYAFVAIVNDTLVTVNKIGSAKRQLRHLYKKPSSRQTTRRAAKKWRKTQHQKLKHHLKLDSDYELTSSYKPLAIRYRPMASYRVESYNAYADFKLTNNVVDVGVYGHLFNNKLNAFAKYLYNKYKFKADCLYDVFDIYEKTNDKKEFDKLISYDEPTANELNIFSQLKFYIKSYKGRSMRSCTPLMTHKQFTIRKLAIRLYYN